MIATWKKALVDNAANTFDKNQKYRKNVLQINDRIQVFTELPHLDECRPPIGPTGSLFCSAGGGQHGGDIRRTQECGIDP